MALTKEEKDNIKEKIRADRAYKLTEEDIRMFILAEEEKTAKMNLQELLDYLKDTLQEKQITEDNLRIAKRNIYVLRQEFRRRIEEDKSGDFKKEYIEIWGEEEYMALYDQ